MARLRPMTTTIEDDYDPVRAVVITTSQWMRLGMTRPGWYNPDAPLAGLVRDYFEDETWKGVTFDWPAELEQLEQVAPDIVRAAARSESRYGQPAKREAAHQFYAARYGEEG